MSSGRAGRGRGVQLRDHKRPGRKRASGSDPVAAGSFGCASLPDRSTQTVADRTDRRERRGMRDNARGPAHRLRGECSQPLHGLRCVGRFGTPGRDTTRLPDGREVLCQGDQQGNAQDHVEDGYLHDPQLSRGQTIQYIGPGTGSA